MGQTSATHALLLSLIVRLLFIVTYLADVFLRQGMAHGPVKIIGPRFGSLLDRAHPAALLGTAQLATLAAGCFWSVELAYMRVPGASTPCPLSPLLSSPLLSSVLSVIAGQ